MKNQYRKWIQDRLRQVRNILGTKQKDAAEAMGVKLKNYQSYEQGRAQPSITLIKRYCKSIGWTVDKFLEDSPENEHEKVVQDF